MIESHDFGYIVIDGQRYTSDVIIYPDRVESDWVRRTGHRLTPDDLGQLLEQDARTLIVGTGNHGLVRAPFPAGPLRWRGMVTRSTDGETR